MAAAEAAALPSSSPYLSSLAYASRLKDSCNAHKQLRSVEIPRSSLHTLIISKRIVAFIYVSLKQQ